VDSMNKRDHVMKRAFRLTNWKTSRGFRLLLFFFFVLVFYFSASAKWLQETYDIELNAISEITIKATSTIENKAATLRARANASESVSPVYAYTQLRNEDLLELLFSKLELVNADTQMIVADRISIYKSEFPQIYKDYFDSYLRGLQGTYKESLIDEVKARLSEYEYRIPEETYFKLPRLSTQELSDMESAAKSIISRLMNDRMTDPQTARAKVPELVNASQLTSKNSRETIQEMIRFVLTPNRFYDEEATKEAKIKAAENTKPVFIQKDEIILLKGERITEEKFALLDSLELLNSKTSKWPQAGSAIVAFLFVILLVMFIKQSELPIASNNVHLLMLLVILTLTTLSMVVVSVIDHEKYPYIGYMAPVAMGTMLITLLLNARIAFVASMVLSALASILLNEREDMLFDYRYGFVAAVVCFVAIFAIRRAGQRSSILRAGVFIAAFGGLSALALLMVANTLNAKDVLYTLFFSFAGGLITAILVMGLLPFFEVAFGILSPMKLVELSNPNHPLLRKLLTETPGTYHHSVMVGNLSEAAAEAVGADGLLCRVGSFYHDVGKTRRPSYFIENQTHIENPHDHIDPSLSKSIIIAHVRDGVEMQLEHKLPKQIRDIAEQHHGTTLLKFFYHKALKQLEESGDEETAVTEEEYRYPGPKAQTKEAAIVGIADALEAAVRSLRNPTPEQIDSMVRKIMKSRLDDEQLSDCDLTLKELDVVARTMKETLIGIFHSRIEYPEEAAVKTK